MAKTHRDLLSVLKSELIFLEKGGYAKPSSQRPFIFQDSPACLNYSHAESPTPCSDCTFFELVPLDRRKEKIPCRHIPLDQEGQTLDFLYRRASQEEIETAISRWLRKTIEELEGEQIQERSFPEAINDCLMFNESSSGTETGSAQLDLHRDDTSTQIFKLDPEKGMVRRGSLTEIVILSSDLENRRHLREILVNLGLDPICLSTLRECRETLANRKVVLVFCDAQVSDGSYRDLLGTYGDRKPRLVLTCHEGREHFLEATSSGVFAVITSPCRPTDVEWMVIQAKREDRRIAESSSAATSETFS